MEKKIVFDLGGVLLDWDPRYLYREIFRDRDEMEFFLTEICSPSWNAQTDSKKTFQEAIQELILKHPDYEQQIRLYHSRWREMVAGEIGGSVEILQELKESGHKLAALSNWSAETFPLVKDDYKFLDWFDPLVLSGEVGAVKPCPQIFRIFLQQTGWQAAECLFIDDSIANIQEASRQGFRTIHFQSPPQLRRELEHIGML